MMKRTVIENKKSIFELNLSEIWRYRQLIFSLAWRDIKVKYAQTFIGFLWALINPLITLLILIFVFHKVAKIETDGVPYYLFAITGLSAWVYFANLLSESGSSLIANQSMIKKLYFPRLVIPLSKAVSTSVEFVITLFLLGVLLIFSGWRVGNYIEFLPLFILFSLLAGLTGGIWFSALSVRYRDFSFITPFIVRIGLYITPIAYPISQVPEEYQSWLYINPMTGIVEGFRWSLLGLESPDTRIWYSLIYTLVLFLLGLIYFKRVEKTMADII